MECEKKPLIVICGPTAAGKTALAVQLASHLEIEVISADSRQVYRDMDIGTAKPTPDEMRQVRHHMVDVVSPDEPFSVSDFTEQGRDIVRDLHRQGKCPVVVGGTGLYIQALTSGLAPLPGGDDALRARLNHYAELQGDEALHRRLAQGDPETAARIHPNNRIRIIRALEVYEITGIPMSAWLRDHAFGDCPFRTLFVGLAPPRDVLNRRIECRARLMVEQGLLEETRSLLDKGYSPELKTLKTLGYREMVDVIAGRTDLASAVEQINVRTRQYAKRQLTWFRKREDIIWFEYSEEFAKINGLIADFLR